MVSFIVLTYYMVNLLMSTECLETKTVIVNKGSLYNNLEMA